MAVAIMLDFPEGGAEQYDEVLHRMELGGVLPPGALFHVAGPGPGGGWRVVDTWESEALFDDFARRRIMPLSQEAGFGEPAVTRFDAHLIRYGDTPVSEMRLFQVVRFPALDAAGFDALDAEVVGDAVPPALSFHVNGGLGAGWIVADGWESREARDRFMAERVGPAVGRRPGLEPPVVEDLEVHGTLAPRTADVA